MNFLDLYKKIHQLDEGLSQGNIMPQAVSSPPSAPVVECGEMGECGMSGPTPPMQQDSVTMNVSMNATGVSGIRNLMNVLQNLENTIDTDKKDIVVSKPSKEPVDVDISAVEELPPPATPEPPMMPDTTSMIQTATAEDETEITDDLNDYANDPEIRKLSVAAITGTGDDIHSKGKEAPKQAGGGNPWNVSESKIAAKLSKHYEEIKKR